MDNNIKRERAQNPRANASIFEILTFSWMIDLFKIGRSRDLQEEDLYAILNDHTSSKLVNELEKKWTIEMTSAPKSNRQPSLLRALFNMFGAKYMFYGFLLSFDELVLKMSQPLFIGGLLAYFDHDASKRTDLGYAYVCASGLVCSMFVSIVLVHSTYTEIIHDAMKVRIACSSILFRKALRLSHTALGETTVGQIINLLSNDMNRFDLGLLYPHYIWIGPMQTIIITYFLWQEIGVSSLFGIVILLIVIPLQGWLGKKIFEIRLKTAKWTDERGRLLNEIIAAIEVIKMYTWEKPFAKLIEYARKKELQYIRRITTIYAISFLYRGILIRFQLFTCILAYVLLGNYISIQKVFVIISFYNLLQTTMTVFFCTGIAQSADMLATIERIQKFLLLEERDGTITDRSECTPDFVEPHTDSNGIFVIDTKTKRSNGVGIDVSNGVGIDVSNVTATWKEGQNSNALDRINLTLRRDQLAVIIGPVGAGKSSILQMILGELPLSEGKVSVRGVISYASQEPWLFTGSVQQNILFNSPMNNERYKQVIKSCGLERDFERFPDGDRTVVGERGVTLSGGQKARINLARAVYKEADIYLLDDPLSAVDSRVGKHLFEKCIKGYLRNKTTILTTHQIQFLTNEEKIVLMEKAKIVTEGSYQELLASGIDFEEIRGSADETKIEKSTSSDNVSLIGSNECIEQLTVDESRLHGDKKKPNEVNETKSSGNVSKRVYSSYISSFGSSFIIFLFFAMYTITQALITAVDFWITLWVNQEDYAFRNNNNNTSNDEITLINEFSSFTTSSNYRQTFILVFIALNILLMIAIILRSAVFVAVCTKASYNLHDMMLNAVIRAKMLFFHANSSGRIMNRFSNDMGVIDEHLPNLLLEMFQMGFRILGIVFAIGLVDIYFLIPTIIMGILCYYIRSFYLSTSRSIKRLEGVARSPVLGHMNASVQGLTTIRAYKAEQTIYNEFDKHQDFHSSAWYLFICSNGALGLWMDMASIAYITVIIFSFLVFSDYTYGGYVGLVITQTIGLVGLLQWAIRQSTMVENQMISVERVFEYANCPKEVDFRCPSDKKLPNGWPDSGSIVFKNFNLRYSLNSPYVLNNLNIQIRPTEKVGIVGRTGAGKSSIIKALFRLAMNEGEIIIDDFEIHELGLLVLRSKLSVIPQEPVLYSGTMRYNLDPFDEFSDHVLWNALDEVHLKALIENLPDGLTSKISESGSNFSVGQKQLICLARALVRNNSILILDEATANIDAQTDALIQNTIRRKFRTATVITVAHRLNTVMDSDRVLVMDAGSVIEFDHPHVLLGNKNGLFHSMVEQTGPTTSALIHSVAAESFNTMHKQRSVS